MRQNVNCGMGGAGGWAARGEPPVDEEPIELHTK